MTSKSSFLPFLLFLSLHVVSLSDLGGNEKNGTWNKFGFGFVSNSFTKPEKPQSARGKQTPTCVSDDANVMLCY